MSKRSTKDNIPGPQDKDRSDGGDVDTRVPHVPLFYAFLGNLVSTQLLQLEGTTSDLSKTDEWIRSTEPTLASDAKDIQTKGLTYLSMDKSTKAAFQKRVDAFADSSRDFFTYLKARAAEIPWNVGDGFDEGEFRRTATIDSCETLTRLGVNILKAVQENESSASSAQSRFDGIHHNQRHSLLKDETHQNTHRRIYELHDLWVKSKVPEKDVLGTFNEQMYE